MSQRHPYLAVPPPIGFAHRGGAGRWGENTFEAFGHAVELGYLHLETDVHLTSDGQVVAFHDDTLDRTTDLSGPIGAHDWARIAAARVEGGGHIARLGDLLDAFPDRRFNIDAKSDAVTEPLMRVLVDAAALDRVCVASFSSARLARLRLRAGPSLCTALGPGEVGKLRAGTTRGIAGSCAQVPPRARGVPLVTPRLIDRAHRAGLAVHVWTIDDAEEMTRLLDLGVDGIMTDALEVLRDILDARGAWPPG